MVAMAAQRWHVVALQSFSAMTSFDEHGYGFLVV